MSVMNHQSITEAIEKQFPGKIIAAETPYDFLTLTVSKDIVKDLIQFLYDDPSLDFKYLTTCFGMHFPDAAERFGMVYQLHSLPTNARIRLKAFTNEDPPHFPSLTGIFKAANWMERETYDFFGFKFNGHPDLRRILNMDSLEGWPLRKEFPLEDQDRKDKDDSMFGR